MEANQHSKQPMKTIESILDKYWQGETSLEEENQLRTFFNQPHVPNHLKVYQPLFAYQNEEQQKRVSDNFEQRVLERIRQYDEPMKPVINPRSTSYWMRYAAILIIGLAIFGGYQYYQSTQPSQLKAQVDTFDDPEEAYAETKRALLMVSNQLNRGEKEMSRLSTFTDVQDNYLLKN